MKSAIILFVNCLLVTNLFAQSETENQSPFTYNFGADIVSRYVWRGTQFGGNSPCIQPGVSLAYKSLELGAWGSYSLSGLNTSQEFDLYLSYTFLNDLLTTTITDYYLPTEGTDYHYFKYGKDVTGHLFEASISYNGTADLPVSVLAAVNFYGADAIKLQDDLASTDFNSKTGIQYSNYIEIGYTTNIKEQELKVFLGGTLNNPQKANANTGFVGEAGFYGTGPGIVNFGVSTSKEIKITEHYSLPVSASIITNPQAEKVFFVFGFTF